MPEGSPCRAGIEAEGFTASSRWLSEATPPDQTHKHVSILKGWQSSCGGHPVIAVIKSGIHSGCEVICP
jgi:hypothetical protein